MIRDASEALSWASSDTLSRMLPDKADYLKGVLEAHYNQTFRTYHNLDHISDMLQKLHNLRWNTPDFPFNHDRQAALGIAILFHDTVYSLRAKTPENEVNSADVAITTGIHYLRDIDWQFVYRLIMATAHTKLPPDASFEEKLIADLDLSTLAGSFDEYMKVNARVKNEYFTIYTEEEWNAGRKQWLTKQLDKPKIFYLDYFNEHEAKLNLMDELETLEVREIHASI